MSLATPSRKFLVQSTLADTRYNRQPDNTDSKNKLLAFDWNKLCYYGLSLMRTLTCGPTVVTIKAVDCTHKRDKHSCTGAV